MRNIEEQWPPLPPWEKQEKQQLDFIDWVVLPFCFCLLIPIAALALCLNLWDWVKGKR